ncbi:MAG: hypothetical protein WA109_14925 [Bellilinea sp.]
MPKLTTFEKLSFEKLFGMETGYVIDFSNRTFGEFILENVGIDIFQLKYAYTSGSKANRLRAFWSKEDNLLVGKLLLRLLEYWKIRKNLNNQIITLSEKDLYEKCVIVAENLLNNNPNKNSNHQEFELIKKKERESNKEYQLNLLLKMFDDLSISSDYQTRGFLLQDLLNKLFLLYEISVSKSFQRNEGGEQIDGAFSLQGWYYLIECKWTKKLADIRELDSLLGKVNRSGKQAMGLFLSIDGWSENVPYLLKQNPQKCIILMEGYDLRNVLNGTIDLIKLLTAKITKLSLDSEPYLSVKEIMKENTKLFH